ncbi:MAG TPA: TetR/AcrR family transcriptional regulator [Planctomycetota bacterium]|nr:TetR/AcrR family transcriptional regulator [Planctomycetota bacterium]
MSGKQREDPKAADPRARKTRKALLDSLIGLVHRRRYEEFAVGDIVDDAEVGRSTFYEHYKSKDDMLVETMGQMLDVMASVASDVDDVAGLEGVLLHFLENKKFARTFFASAASRPAMERARGLLAERIRLHLEARQERHGVRASLDPALIAAALAEAQFAYVRTWISNVEACSAKDLARAMRASAIGSISALC